MHSNQLNQGDFPCFEGKPNLKPSERFKCFARALFAVPKTELNEILDDEPPKVKRDGTPKRKPGPPPGTPNWKSKKKQNEQPTP